MIQMDFTQISLALLGTLAGGSAGWCLRATRRKALAEASITELTVSQNALLQITELQQDVMEKNKSLKALNNEVLDLTRRLTRLEIDLERFRCDDLQCSLRKNRRCEP